MTSGIQFWNPYSPPGTPVRAYTLHLKSAITAPVIGMVSNLFPDATPLLNDLKEPLRRLLEGVQFRDYDKGSRRASSFAIDDDKAAEIAKECDAVINAYGHCGSCTAGTIRDALKFTGLQRPVVSLVTEKFLGEASMIIRSGGLSGVPVVAIPHPTAGREAEFHAALAEAIAPAVAEALKSGVSSLKAPAIFVQAKRVLVN